MPPKESYEYFYSGSSSSLDPNYGTAIGYKIPLEEIGATTSIQSANQLQEVGNLLNQGVKAIELSPVSPEVFETIPKQHFKEIARLQKLTGAETTLHAPIIEPSGITQQGWQESNREMVERQLSDEILRSHDLDPKGGMNVTVHASGIPGREKIKLADGREETSQLIAINQESGQLIPIKPEKRYHPETGEIIQVDSADEMLDIANNSEWANTLMRMQTFKKDADELRVNATQALPLLLKARQGQELTPGEAQLLNQQMKSVEQSSNFMNHVEASLRTAYNTAYKYSDEHTKEKLLEAAKDYKEIHNQRVELAEKYKREEPITPEERFKLTEKESNAIDNMLNYLSQARPEVYKPVEEFALDKSAKTFANVAFDSYKKYGDKAPTISIENFMPGTAFSRSDELKKLIKESREKFVEKAKEKGYNQLQAQRVADRIIGATWDLGHINMMKKFGYDKKDIIKEGKKIAPFVKHVHLADNFGFHDSHLPPGMGEVSNKEVLKELEKAGFKGKKIVEAGAFVQHFKTSPTPYVLEAFGSPLYPMMAQPSWNQIRYTIGGYFEGYGEIFPEQHFSMYGSGFSNLPSELGGQVGSSKSRFSGAPAE